MKVLKHLYSNTHKNNCLILSQIKERKIIRNRNGVLIIECNNTEANKNLLNKSTMQLLKEANDKLLFIRA